MNNKSQLAALALISALALSSPLTVFAQTKESSPAAAAALLVKVIGQSPLNGTTERFLNIYDNQNPPNISDISSGHECKVWMDVNGKTATLNYYSGKNSAIQRFQIEKGLKNYITVHNNVVSTNGGSVQGPVSGVQAADSPYNSYGRENDGYGNPVRSGNDGADSSRPTGPYQSNPPTRGSYSPGQAQPADGTRHSGPYQQNPPTSGSYLTYPSYGESVEMYQLVLKSANSGITIRISEAFGKAIHVYGANFQPKRAIQVSIATSKMQDQAAQLKNCSLFFK